LFCEEHPEYHYLISLWNTGISVHNYTDISIIKGCEAEHPCRILVLFCVENPSFGNSVSLYFQYISLQGSTGCDFFSFAY